MDHPIVHLQCRIASLEAQLTMTRQELQISRETIIFLAGLLGKSQQSQVDETPPDNTLKSSPGKIDPLALYPLLHATLRKSAGTSQVQVKSSSIPILQPQQTQARSTSNLIDLDSPQKEVPKTELRAEAEPFYPLTDDNKPPVIDLSFKGLRTVHDGPLDDSSKTISFETKWSKTTQSCKENSKKTSPEISSAEFTTLGIRKPKGTSKIDAITLNNSISKFANNKSYRSEPVERRSASASDSSDYFRKPLFLFHGIHYKPREDDLFLNRSRVMIFNLPKDITLSRLIPKLRGGVIISCQLLETGFAYPGRSAMVRFSSYVEAMKCVDYATTNPMLFDDKIASIQLIPTPSYPLAPEIYKNIFEHGHTRCLRIYEFDRIRNQHIKKEYTDPQFIEYQVSNGCGDWFVRFTSVERASALWAELEALRSTRKKSGFMPDPCDIEECRDGKEWKSKEIKVMEMESLKWND